jgi:hypothetical protein
MDTHPVRVGRENIMRQEVKGASPGFHNGIKKLSVRLEKDIKTKAGKHFFLYSLFSKISPQCNIPNGNQRNESKVLICFSGRSHLERADFGKLSSLLRREMK